jgi:hypothetical protein
VLPEGGGAAVGEGRGLGEIEGPEDVGRGVEEGDDFCPSDVFVGVGSGGWVKEDTLAVIEDIVRAERERVPFGPPTRCNVGKVGVGGVAGVEVAIVKAGRGGVGAAGFDAGLVEVDGDQVPTGTECARVKVGDEEEPIGGGEDRGGKFDAGGGA